MYDVGEKESCFLRMKFEALKSEDSAGESCDEMSKYHWTPAKQ